jgi:hypothetical protein
MGSFKKIISSVAFNPGMLDQLAFYSKRLKQEESVRRLGLVLIILTMFVQLFAAMVPAERSLAASDNDVVRGGVNNITELRGKYFAQADVRELYNRFGISGGDIDDAGVSNTTFNFQEQGSKGTRSVGRVNFATTEDHNLGSFSGTTFYSRSAGEWQGSAAAYFFGQHKGTDNNMYFVWVLKDCGNIAYRRADAVGVLTPETPNYTPPPVTTETPAPTPTPVPAPTIDTPPPVETETPQEVACTSLKADKTEGKKSLSVKYKGEYSASSPNTVSGLTFDFGDGSSVRQTSTETEHTYVNNTEQTITYKASVTVHSTKGDKKSPACETTIQVAPETCSTAASCVAPKRTKSVQNITQKLNSAKSILSKARASDILEYSLTTTNSNDATINDYVIEDYVGDLLNYAEIDQTFLKAQGGSFSTEKKTITWPKQAIAAHANVKKEFRVVLKNPLPSTNRPNATSPDFDCKLQNGYGNEVVVNVDCPTIKNIEELPNTGPGTTVVAAFSLSTISGYFVARARLLSKELSIIKRGWRS